MKNPLIFLFLLFGIRLYSQQTLVYTDSQKPYRNGLELFDEKNFVAAREKFEEIYKQQKRATTNKNEVLLQNLEYYIAASAVEANDKDAEKLCLEYNRRYHETDKRHLINYLLGRNYYKNGNYSQAIEYLTKIRASDLDNHQIVEYKFDLGYAYFTKKKFEEAKPLFRAIKEIKDKYYYPANYYYAFICFYSKDYNEALKSFLSIEDSKMYASVIPYYITQIYYLKKDYPKTIDYIEKNLEKSDVSYKSELNHILGQAYFQQSEYAKALPYLEQYVGAEKKVSKEDIYQLGFCQYQNGDYKKAIGNFQQLNLLNEKMGQNATYALADCYLKTEQKDKAKSAFQSAASMTFDKTIQATSLYNYGKLSYESGNSSEAITSMENYLNNNQDGTYTEDATEVLTSALLSTKNYSKAYKIIESVKFSSPKIKEAYQIVTYFNAVELFNDKKDAETIDMCDKSLKNPVNQDLQALALYLKGEALYNQAKYEEAISCYARFNQLFKIPAYKNIDVSKFRANYNLGYCWLKKKNYNNAKLYYEKAIEEAEGTNDAKAKVTLSPDLYLRYADCAFVTKDYTKAVSAYEKIALNEWNQAEYALFQKGIIQGLMNRNTDKIATLQTLLNKYPSSVYQDQAYYEIGETNVEDAKNDAALVAYNTVISRFQNSALVPKAYMKIALVDYNIGRKEEAVSNYKTVIKKYPDSKEAKEALAAMKDVDVELGKAEDFVDFAQHNSNLKISSTEEDSLLYQSADGAYSNGDCNKAADLFRNYLSKFPKGFFADEAHYHRAECLTKLSNYAEAVVDYEAIANNKYAKFFEKSLLKGSGIAYYELKDYTKANTFYKQLLQASTSTANTYTALLGLLQTTQQLNQPEEAVKYADQLIVSGQAKEGDLVECYYLKGKASFAQKDYGNAMVSFNKVCEMTVSEKAAESKYLVAVILNEGKEYKASLDTCLKIKNKYASYEYWVVKTFILIADNYYNQNNSFQATATLESIIANYKGDAKLVEEAKVKLDIIKNEELKKSKIEINVPTEQLQMDTIHK